MKVKPKSINRSSRAVLLGAVAGPVVCFGLSLSVLAQATPYIRLVDYVSPSLLSSLQALRPMIPTNTALTVETNAWDMGDLIKPTTTTSADRWIIFEMLQAAKYGLDRMTFTAQETTKRLEFTYNIADEPSTDTGSQAATPQYSLPMFGRFGQAQLKSDVTIHDPQTGEAFIGVKLVIPFGQGG
jgi:hypothetical protein